MNRAAYSGALLAGLLLMGMGLPASGAPADSDATAGETSSVEIKGMKNPELRSYRTVSAGLDAFDRGHALAPAAPVLRFRLFEAPRGSPPKAEPITLRLAGDGEALQLPVSQDGLVTIPRMQKAYDDDAELISNRKRDQLIALPEVRSDGLPDNVRRLGDLRLECEVITAVMKAEIGFMARNAITALLLTPNWCSKAKFKMKFHAVQHLDGATLVYQERRLELEHGEWDYRLPISDQSWPDDARVELRFSAPP